MTDKEKELDRFNGGKMDIVKIPLCNYCRYNEFPQSCVLSYDRLKSIGAKKEKNPIIQETAYPISINVNGNDNLIDLNITKPSNGNDTK